VFFWIRKIQTTKNLVVRHGPCPPLDPTGSRALSHTGTEPHYTQIAAHPPLRMNTVWGSQPKRPSHKKSKGTTAPQTHDPLPPAASWPTPITCHPGLDEPYRKERVIPQPPSKQRCASKATPSDTMVNKGEEAGQPPQARLFNVCFKSKHGVEEFAAHTAPLKKTIRKLAVAEHFPLQVAATRPAHRPVAAFQKA